MQVIKSSLQISISTISQTFCKKESFNLSVEPNIVDHLEIDQLKEIYEHLNQSEKNIVETIYWELSKKEDSRIDGFEYGKVNFFNNLKITSRSLHRGGFIPKKYFKKIQNNNDNNEVNKEINDGLIRINFTVKLFRNNITKNSQYYSLGEKYNNNFDIGYCGYVNGMGNTLGWAGRDASIISDYMLDGVDLHCVYLPSFQISPDGYSPSNNDYLGFSMDVARHLSINGGDFSKTSCLIAQQWIDYLSDNPNKYFLQIAASDGGTFACSAINLMKKYSPHLLSRLSIILLSPGCFLIPDGSDLLQPNQILNFVKLEDHLISKFATGANYIGKHSNIIIVPHNSKNDHPHNFLSFDFIQTVKPYIENFKKFGKLIN